MNSNCSITEWDIENGWVLADRPDPVPVHVIQVNVPSILLINNRNLGVCYFEPVTNVDKPLYKGFFPCSLISATFTLDEALKEVQELWSDGLAEDDDVESCCGRPKRYDDDKPLYGTLILFKGEDGIRLAGRVQQTPIPLSNIDVVIPLPWLA